MQNPEDSMAPNETTIVELDFFRLSPPTVAIYSVAYAAVFLAGLVGNSFVLLAVLSNTNLRSTTDYLISSLGAADLLIILFCLPTTLLNNLLTEWQLGAIGCKASTWINSTTSCASIFTLVAVTADRYLAICHTLKHLSLWGRRRVLSVIAGIWLVSGVLASPNFWIYDEVLFEMDTPEGKIQAKICLSNGNDLLHFVVVNLVIAFLLPVALISVSYSLIFRTVTKHRSLAVDSRIRDERVKLRVAQMMLTVVVVFIGCWTPLYSLYCYFFLATDKESEFFQFASSILRPIFQWLSLLSSSFNPLIYVAYSQKYRHAFRQLLLTPCQAKYRKLRRATRATLRLAPLPEQSPVSLKGSLHYTTYHWTSATAEGEVLNKWGRKVSVQSQNVTALGATAAKRPPRFERNFSELELRARSYSNGSAKQHPHPRKPSPVVNKCGEDPTVRFNQKSRADRNGSAGLERPLSNRGGVGWQAIRESEEG